MTNDKMTNCGYASLLISDLSRRDCRTQPGVLTPGNDKNLTRPEGAEDIRLAIPGSANRLGATLYRPFRAGPCWDHNPGLKPRAESCRPFGTNSNRTLRDLAMRCRPVAAAHRIARRCAAH